MLSIFYEIITGRGPDLLRAYVLTVLIQVVAINILVDPGYLKKRVPPFFGVVTALSGLVYGLGMVLAMGCAGAILYRVGEGKLDYVFALIAYTVSAWASNNWLVEPIHGDNVMHGLSVVPLLAMGCLTFMFCIFIGVWVGVRLGWLK
jgi:hypothetical protein